MEGLLHYLDYVCRISGKRSDVGEIGVWHEIWEGWVLQSADRRTADGQTAEYSSRLERLPRYFFVRRYVRVSIDEV